MRLNANAPTGVNGQGVIGKEKVDTMSIPSAQVIVNSDPTVIAVGEIRRAVIEIRDDLAADLGYQRTLVGDSLTNRLDRVIGELRTLQARLAEGRS